MLKRRYDKNVVITAKCQVIIKLALASSSARHKKQRKTNILNEKKTGENNNKFIIHILN